MRGVDSLAVRSQLLAGAGKVCAPPNWQASGGGLSCPRLEPWTGRYPAVGGSAVTEDNLALDVRGSSGKTAVRMALSPRLLIRMRSPSPSGWAASRLVSGLEPTLAYSRSAGDKRAWLALARSTAVALV
jgi:hypothetical protein